MELPFFGCGCWGFVPIVVVKYLLEIFICEYSSWCVIIDRVFAKVVLVFVFNSGWWYFVFFSVYKEVFFFDLCPSCEVFPLEFVVIDLVVVKSIDSFFKTCEVWRVRKVSWEWRNFDESDDSSGEVGDLILCHDFHLFTFTRISLTTRIS